MTLKPQGKKSMCRTSRVDEFGIDHIGHITKDFYNYNQAHLLDSNYNELIADVIIENQR